MSAAGSAQSAFFPGRAAIDSYGNGGFRFAGMSHRGSLLLLPSGIHGWAVTSMDELTGDALAVDKLGLVFTECPQVSLLLLGTGEQIVQPPRSLVKALTAVGIGLEVMDSGAAARTYNVLLAERRPVAAALLPVD